MGYVGPAIFRFKFGYKYSPSKSFLVFLFSMPPQFLFTISFHFLVFMDSSGETPHKEPENRILNTDAVVSALCLPCSVLSNLQKGVERQGERTGKAGHTWAQFSIVTR